MRNGTIAGRTEVEVGGVAGQGARDRGPRRDHGRFGRGQRTRVRVVPETGLLVGLADARDVQNDSPIGDVRYEEHYELELASLDPRR